MAENPIFGRKIFFLNPTYSLLRQVIRLLRIAEYEVYVIEDYREAKNMLRSNPDSMLFISPSGMLSFDGWFNFVKSFQSEMQLENILVGFVVSTMKDEQKNLIFDFLKPAAGIIDINGSVEDVTNNLIDVLELNGAKGRRQYVRAPCLSDKEANLYWQDGNKIHSFKLIDISSVGIAVQASQQIKKSISEKSIIKNATLKLGSLQYDVSAVVLAIKPNQQNPNILTMVLLLLPDTPTEIKDKIRDYTQSMLQKIMLASISHIPLDTANYSADYAYYNEAIMDSKELEKQKEEELKKAKEKINFSD